MEKIVVGLGNPGSRYEKSRHNAGWMVLDRLAERSGSVGRTRARDGAASVRGRLEDMDLLLVKPTTYMNLSGPAVRKVLAREGVALPDLLVVVDDLALTFGRLRMRERGSDGGHNGLRSIIDEMGTQAFARLRVGIGRPARGAVEHVLGDFSATERDRLDEVDRRRRRLRDGLGAPRTRACGRSVERLEACSRPPGRGDRVSAIRACRGGSHDGASHDGASHDGATRARDRWHRPNPDRLAPAAAKRARQARQRDAPVSGGARLTEPAAPSGLHRSGRRSTAGRSPAGEHAAAIARHRIPDLAVLTRVLAGTGEVQALVDRYQRSAVGLDGRDLRHVTYAGVPHGAKSYLAAALVLASEERIVWIARDAEIADRVAEELTAWLGEAAAVVTLEPRSALAYERSELVRDESAARVAALAAWNRAGGPARVLVASLQALFQRTLTPERHPDRAARPPRRSPTAPGWRAEEPRRPGLRARPRGRRTRRVRPPGWDRGRVSCRPGPARAGGVVRGPDRVAAGLRSR